MWKIGINLRLESTMWMESGRFTCRSKPNVLRWNVMSKIEWIWNKQTKTCSFRVNQKVVHQQRTNLKNTDLRKGRRQDPGHWFMIVQYYRPNN